MTTAGRRLAPFVAVAFAIAVAGWQAGLHWASRNPTPVATLGIGESTQVGGSTYTFEGFETATSMPASVPEDGPVAAPDGAVLILLTFTTEIVDDGVDPETHFCEPTLVDEQGRQWRPDSTLGFSVERPAAFSCTGTAEDPIRIGEPLEVGYVFLVPASVVDDLTLELDLGVDDDDAVLALEP